MTQRTGSGPDDPTGLGRVWQVPDAQVASGRIPGYVAAVRVGGALALSLVQDGVLALDDPVARWLPEAASPRVLVFPGAPLDQTTDVTRPVTVRHLLTLTCGWGAVLEATPLQAAMMERGVYP